MKITKEKCLYGFWDCDKIIELYLDTTLDPDVWHLFYEGSGKDTHLEFTYYII